MSSSPGGTLILGASSKLGAAVLSRAAKNSTLKDPIIAACAAEHEDILMRLLPKLGIGDAEIEPAIYDPEKPNLGFGAAALERFAQGVTRIFHLDHKMDRTLSGSITRRHNLAMCERMLELARKVERLEALVVATDVGLAGDYPGKFSEHWIDVGQIPFDEVDQSSIEVESAVAAAELPVIRARVGLLSDFFETGISDQRWRTAAEVLLSSLKIFKALPRFLSIPSAVAKGSLAPLTPVEWAARAIVHCAAEPAAKGKALHLVVSPPPPMEEIVESLTSALGGAKLKGGLPVELVRAIGKIPGLNETARKQADNLASWWTPHRYCLSRNDFDTSLTQSLLPVELAPPQWSEIRDIFFRI